eukprot:scaffold1999_cov36-Attheya_sp.AAC.5
MLCPYKQTLMQLGLAEPQWLSGAAACLSEKEIVLPSNKWCSWRVPAISFEAMVWNVLLVNGLFISTEEHDPANRIGEKSE